MSSSSLYRFLSELTHQLEYSKEFRVQFANSEEHVFVTSSGRLVTQTVKQLNELGIPVTAEERSLIRVAADEAFAAISAKVKTSIKRHDSTFYNGIPHPKTKFTNKSLTAVYRRATGGSKSDIFAKIKRTYSSALPEYYEKVKNIANNHSKLPKSSGDFLHAGHAKQDGVLESGAVETAQDIFFKVADPKLANFVQGSRTKVVAKLNALMAKNADVMHITLEAQKENVATDASDASGKKTAFINAAHTAMEKITKSAGFAGFQGSDTPLERKRKVTIKKVTDPFSKVKGVKVKTEDTKFKVSRGSAQVVITKKVLTKATNLAKFRSPKTGRFVTEEEGLETYLKIKNLINSVLPEIVAGNMGPPALEYRTGRFAEGAEHPRILSIVPGTGSPVASYTYQKYPYQTFEPGFRQGDPNRDPRVIIEASIRQAAIELALGRFNLRRL